MKPSKHLKTIAKLQADLKAAREATASESFWKDRYKEERAMLLEKGERELREYRTVASNTEAQLLANNRMLMDVNDRLWYMLRLHAGDETLKLHIDPQGVWQNLSAFPSNRNY